jgi:hypothetical protein
MWLNNFLVSISNHRYTKAGVLTTVYDLCSLVKCVGLKREYAFHILTGLLHMLSSVMSTSAVMMAYDSDPLASIGAPDLDMADIMG